MLQYMEVDVPLFLAIPTAAYEGVFQAPVVRQVVKNLNMKLMVFDPKAEAIFSMENLKDHVIQALKGYAVKGYNGYSVLTADSDQRFFTIVSTATVKGKTNTIASLIVRLEADRVIIEYDINSKPLVDALLQAGVPRDRIILAYAGEAAPSAV